MKNQLNNTLKTGTMLVLFFLSFVGYGQFNIPPKPTKTTEQTSLYDYAKVLSSDEKSALETKLIQYSDSTSTQIVIITIPSLKGEDIGILTPKWAHSWGIGQAKEDNGVLILLALEERKIWISPGYGVEDRLTAGLTGTIVRNDILPAFKTGNYYMGLDHGVDSIFETLNGKYKAERKEHPKTNDSFGITVIVFLAVFILLIILSRRGGGKGGNGGRFSGPDLAEMIILSSLGRGGFGGGSGGGGFSGGGGGFGGGFGGGGFSGGGAGGSW